MGHRFRQFMLYAPMPPSVGVEVADSAVFFRAYGDEAGRAGTGATLPVTQGSVIKEATALVQSSSLRADDKICLSGVSSQELVVAAVAALSAKAQLVVPGSADAVVVSSTVEAENAT